MGKECWMAIHGSTVHRSSPRGSYGWRVPGTWPAADPWTLCYRSIQVNTLVPGAINTPFLDVMLANPKKLAYILGRIPLGEQQGGDGQAACSAGLDSAASTAGWSGVEPAQLLLDGMTFWWKT